MHPGNPYSDHGSPARAIGDARIPPYAWYALALLTAFHAVNAIDRQVMFVVLEPMKAEFHISDATAGALTGMAHGIAFATTTVPLAWLADRLNRARLLSAMAMIWGCLTAFAGFAVTIPQLFLARMGVGAAEGGTTPACFSLIADYFPPHRRGTAVGVYFVSAAIGTGGTYIVGARVADAFGWRAAFLVAAAPTILISLIAFATLRDPGRGRFDQETTHADATLPIQKVVPMILCSPALMCGIIGHMMAVMTISAYYAFSISMFVREHGQTLKEAAFLVGLATGVSHAFGSVIGGPLCDRITAGRADRIGFFPAAILVIAVPAGLLMTVSGSLAIATIGLFLFTFLAGIWLPHGYATPFTLAPAEARASTMGVTLIFTNLVGTGVGPFLAGFMSDRFGSMGEALATMLVFYLTGAAFLALASWQFRRARMVRSMPATA